MVLALGVNAILSAVAFIWLPGQFYGDTNLCYVIALVGAIAAVSTLIMFFIRKISAGWTPLALIGHGAMLIFVFAGIYLGFGLMAGTQCEELVPLLGCHPLSRADALYFSIVTWTTLGYGDILPRADIHLVAGLEGLLRYLLFGLIVGLLADSLKPQPIEQQARPRASTAGQDAT